MLSLEKRFFPLINSKMCKRWQSKCWNANISQCKSTSNSNKEGKKRTQTEKCNESIWEIVSVKWLSIRVTISVEIIGIFVCRIESISRSLAINEQWTGSNSAHSTDRNPWQIRNICVQQQSWVHCTGVKLCFFFLRFQKNRLISLILSLTHS